MLDAAADVPARVEDVHELALAMPHVKVVDGSAENPVYLVGGKSFVFFRNPRPDAVDPDTGARYPDVIVIWVESEADKQALVQDDATPFFTTAHFDGHPSVLVRAGRLGEITRTELAELIQDAWLSRASPRRRSAWLQARVVRYRYVGPADIAEVALRGAEGQRMRSAAEFAAWVAAAATDEPFTYVVDAQGVLRLAPRRSEHVACAGGGDVLAAGEIAFGRSGRAWAVTEVSNQSTGYCPDASCWPAVAAALERIGLPHPGRFTAAFVFRRCAACGELNVVKDEVFVCAVCDSPLGGRE